VAEIKGNEFINSVEVAFRFLSDDLGYNFTGINAIIAAYDNSDFCIRFEYEERSGYVDLSIESKTQKDITLSLGDLAEAFGGELEQYKLGLSAYEIDVLGRCLTRLGSAMNQELKGLLSGDETALKRAVGVYNQRYAEMIEDMEYGGLHGSACDAWDVQDFHRFLEIIKKIPHAFRTNSEHRRARIAEIKVRESSRQ
jgi:hypothetical protein